MYSYSLAHQYTSLDATRGQGSTRTSPALQSPRRVTHRLVLAGCGFEVHLVVCDVEAPGLGTQERIQVRDVVGWGQRGIIEGLRTRVV